MNKLLCVGLAFAAAAAPVAAQEPGIAVIAARAATPKKYFPPLCPLKNSNNKVNDGADRLKSAVETNDTTKRAKALDEGTAILTGAITGGGQEQNAAAWYYLGRVRLMKGDLVGADSSLGKAQALATDCELDIKGYRARVWEALTTEASKQRKAGNEAGALPLLRAADQIFRGHAYAMISIGEIMSANSQPDSALVYFKRGSEVPVAEGDSNGVQLRNLATFDYGVTLLQLERYPEAIQALRQYVTWDSTNAQGMKALAQAYDRAGQPDSAKAWLDRAVKAGGGAAALSTGSGADPTSLSRLFDQGVSQFNSKDYQAAAETFNTIVQRSPYYRDALFNLANCYLGLKDGPNLLKTAQKLVEIEPLNENNYSLLGRGYQLGNDQASTIKAVERREALPITVTVTSFRIRSDGATLAATVTGRAPKDLTGAPVKSPTPAIVVEYVDESGNAAASQEVALPTLTPGATQQITVQGKGKGIVAWRYHTKP